MLIDKYPAALQHRSKYGHLPLHLECIFHCRSFIIAKCIELYPQTLDNWAIDLLIGKVKNNLSANYSLLSIIFTTRPTSLYDRHRNLPNDIRDNIYFRRRVLHLLPRHVFTATHDADYRDLNWQSRAATIMLLLQTKSQQQSRQRQQSKHGPHGVAQPSMA
jgi:hypothetical protein